MESNPAAAGGQIGQVEDIMRWMVGNKMFTCKQEAERFALRIWQVTNVKALVEPVYTVR